MRAITVEKNKPSKETDYWEDHPEYPAQDWQYEVANGDTRLGYHDWVERQIELHADDPDGEGSDSGEQSG